MSELVVCADVGSTWTKVSVVDLGDATLAGSASHRTTVDSDVLYGLDAAVAAALPPGTAPAHTYVCSSAGGGLRLAVVGQERLVTAEAGRRAGLSAGARVVHVAAGPLDGAGVRELRASRPDIVLLVGGTDGGDSEVLRHNAVRLAKARLRVPVVAAGNADVRDEVVQVLAAGGVPVTAAGNVLPRIGELRPQPAREAVRAAFLRHVIGGRRLSRGPRFAALVRGATPDLVLSAVELLADRTGTDLLVVDVGGATTDVYSAVESAGIDSAGVEVAGRSERSRTVEGDLGVRWSAAGVLEAAAAERLLDPAEEAVLRPAARVRADRPGLVARTAHERRIDLRLAALAVTVALRRHARGELVGPAGPRRGGKDLQRVRLVVGSGGVLRHGLAGAALDASRRPGPAQGVRLLAAALADPAGGWALPRAPQLRVDTDHVLAAAGLLAAEHPAVAAHLLLGITGDSDKAGGLGAAEETRQGDTPHCSDRLCGAG